MRGPLSTRASPLAMSMSMYRACATPDARTACAWVTRARASRYEGEIKFDTSKADGQLKKTACNDKLMSLHPDFKFTPFREAVAMTCEWFEANYDAARKGH